MSRAYRVPYAFHAIVQIADGRAEDELITISEAFARNPVPPFWYQMPLVSSGPERALEIHHQGLRQVGQRRALFGLEEGLHRHARQ
jgi:hypothetical protein